MSEPRWLLTGDYGIGMDSLNWKLMQKAIPKKGGKANWKTVGYYPTLKMLVAGMQRKVLLTYTDNSALKDHLDAVIDHCASAICALNSQLDSIGAGAQTLPPKYAEYTGAG